MHQEAYDLAKQGKSNAEIFAQLELSSGALQRILQTDPKLLFNIVNGRSEYLDYYYDIVQDIALGGGLASKGQWSAILLLIERAERNNQSLDVAHEMVLLGGTSTATTDAPRDAATVTRLLRAQ